MKIKENKEEEPVIEAILKWLWIWYRTILNTIWAIVGMAIVEVTTGTGVSDFPRNVFIMTAIIGTMGYEYYHWKRRETK